MKLKSLWKAKGFKAWFFTSISLSALLLTAGGVLTGNEFLYKTMNSVFGEERLKVKSGDPSKYQYYTGDYKNKKDVLAAANALNTEIVSEGMVLLKNEDKSLPLAKESKVTVFGKNSVDLVLGGSGSNSSSSAQKPKSVYDSLSDAGFTFNPKMKSFYDDNRRSGAGRPIPPDMNSTITGLTGFPIAETPINLYTDDVKSSFAEYDDAAIVVLSRIGGEGFDLPRTMFWDGKGYQNWSGDQLIPGAKSKDSHYLELDQNETDMIHLACQNFENVVIVLNTPNAMELGFLEDNTFGDHLKGAIWMGTPGNSGVMALGKVLNGTVNPSGRLVDTFASDFTKAPTWNNFSNSNMDGGNQYTDKDGNKRNAYFVHYAEGIYTGYRYYETRGYTDGDTWYDNNVVYPFGYGLSYDKNFTWTLRSHTPAFEFGPEGKTEIEVQVTNDGTVAGKDVVELYYSAPYTKNGIEKSHVVLGDFVKTDLLKPGESRSYTLSISNRQMASYDYDDSNHNGFKGYELEAGEYHFYIGKDAHDRSLSLTYNLPNNARYEKDAATSAKIENLFDDVSGKIEQYLSRADWEKTWPQLPDEKLTTLSSSDLKKLASYKVSDKESDPWFTYDEPEQQQSPLTYEEAKIKLYDLIGRDYNDPLWDELLNQLTVEEMANLIQSGNYHTEAIESIDKPKTTDPDGPMGYALFMGNPSVYDTCYYACEVVMGATWNVDLARAFGEMIGNESLVGNQKGDGMPYAGWYAPAVNLHRSSFSGRNFEYYSEDPFLSGKMASAVIQGAKSKGVYTYLKHFALNDQETNRDTNGIATWASEQSMREVYFLPFEMAVKEGKTTAMMSSFNRIGFTWAGGSYNLLTKLLREEWGFKGMVVTDYNLTPYMNVDQMIRAGGDINLSQSKSLSSITGATSVTAIRKAAKNILYTVANSNAMNGFGKGVRYAYAAPIWFATLWSCVGCLLIGLIAWGTYIFYVGYKTDKKAKEQGFYEDGRPYNLAKKERIKTYRLTKGSIIYTSITALALIGATTASIALMTIEDPYEKQDQIVHTHIDKITIQFDHREIQNGEIEVKVGDTEHKFNVLIDTYGVVASEYEYLTSDASIFEVKEDGSFIAHKAGEVVLTARLKDKIEVSDDILVRVIDDSIVKDDQVYKITVIGGRATCTEALADTIVTLYPDEIEDATFQSWTFDVEDVWVNGNTFRMPHSDVVITANNKYQEYTLTLVGATFEDGSETKSVEACSLIEENFKFDGAPSIYYAETPVGWVDAENNFYELNFEMPKKDLTLKPFYVIDGENMTLATGTRKYEGGTIDASSKSILGLRTTSYTIPAGQAEYFFDIMNLSSGTDGFFINAGESMKIFLTFINRGENKIAFRYDVEVGTADVSLESGEMKTVMISATGISSIRPYHHLHLTEDLAGETTIEILGFTSDLARIQLEGGVRFKDGSTDKTVHTKEYAGKSFEEIFDCEEVALEAYEKLGLEDQDGNRYSSFPTKDGVYKPVGVIDGVTYNLSTTTRRYAGGTITAKAMLKNNVPGVEYSMPKGNATNYFDIQNSVASKTGYVIKKGETKQLMFVFANSGENAISFHYNAECGAEADIILQPGEEKKVILTAVGPDSFASDTAPYHHLTLNENLAGSTKVFIAGYVLNERQA